MSSPPSAMMRPRVGPTRPRAGTRRPRGRVSDVIAARLTQYIADGRLVAGERLPAERELARQFRTSRVSIREAYRSLEELGLLEIRRGATGGAFVARLDYQRITRSLGLLLRLGQLSHTELTEARALLEPPVARLAARRALPEDVERLEALLRRQEAALKSREGPRALALEFHRLVAQAARNRPLEILMNSLADLTVESLAHIGMSAAVHRHVVLFHGEILDAIRAHDEQAAYEVMLEHVDEVQARLGKDLLLQQRAARTVPWRRRRP